MARPEDIRALLERYVAPFRKADELARETIEIARSRQAAEDRERRRRALLDIQSLVNVIFFQASGVNSPGRWRCKEQLDLSSHLIDIDADLKDCRMLAGAGQENEAFTWEVKARYEIEADCVSWPTAPDGQPTEAWNNEPPKQQAALIHIADSVRVGFV